MKAFLLLLLASTVQAVDATGTGLAAIAADLRSGNVAVVERTNSKSSMKRWLVWIVLSCSVVARGDEAIELECRLLGKEMPVRTEPPAPAPKDRLVALSALILAQNKSNTSIRLPTANADVDITAQGNGIAVVLKWEIQRSWRGTPLVIPPDRLQIVELRPGESVLIVADFDLPAADMPKLARAVLKISPDFGERYGVYRGNLTGILRMPSAK